MNHAQALSGDAGFVKRIASSRFSGIVHSIFDKTINIQCSENGELYTIACNQLDNGPNTLVVDRKRFQNSGIAVNDQVLVSDGMVSVGKQFTISCQDHVVRWECVLPAYPSDQGSLLGNVAVMKDYLAAHGKTGGMKKVLQPANVFEAEVSRLLVSRSSQLVEDLAALRWSKAHEHSIGLVGLGPGLTPSGDDFLTGLFSVYHMPNIPRCLPHSFFAEIVLASAQRTNEISFMMLKKAAIGHVRESIVRLLQSIISGTTEEVVLSLGHVLNIGSSSGTDMALGLLSGLELQIEAGGNVCLSKS
ncbi:hypothetical protein AN963_12105 [Brevibacillus choshinensis]|uniref:DUF2877 domain-containing protein n=1 Tax=Brevibacillus choshinensis TaxID=54911 RepID=A0ABR5N5A8_BRECH|nr:DUF2877 domain-containing protein [Brevibacillus choshinensis]KQL45783.1 hypothetical protein AN963_12105 [Brevibacillus choshinensis]